MSHTPDDFIEDHSNELKCITDFDGVLGYLRILISDANRSSTRVREAILNLIVDPNGEYDCTAQQIRTFVIECYGDNVELRKVEFIEDGILHNVDYTHEVE